MNLSSRLLGAACAAALSLAALPASGQTSSSTTVTDPATGTSTTTTTLSTGLVSDFSPDVITVRSEGAAPIRYSYTKTTEYVDDAGVPVSMSVVKSGLPVTVYYAKEGDRMVARRVVVRRTTSTTAPVAPVVEKETTTTTTTTTGGR